LLLVTSSRDEREMYAEWFRRHGCCPLQAATAEHAYQLAVELAPQVVITDVRLPGKGDGLSLTQRLKQDERTRKTIVVVLSGYVLPTDDEAARRAGCDLIVHKPCLPDALANAVEALLGPPSRPRSHRPKRNAA
jgi:CheY-like chemotaxis protein